MIVQLDRVVFDHGLGAPETRALHVRQDGATAAGPNTAAFALVPTSGQQLTIAAEFSSPQALGVETPPGTNIEIRGRAVSPALGLLGNVRAATVTTPASGASTGLIQLELVTPKLRQKGIGKYDVAWNWQFRLTPTDTWVFFQRSDHVVYVTFDVPAPPWTQAADAVSARRWPWTRVLDWACDWASGVKLTSNTATALKKIGKKIEAGLYALGSRESLPLTYDGNSAFAAGGVFAATEFLALLNGDVEETFVNCTDCSVAVAVFGNCLGADLKRLRVSRTDGPQLDTNRLVKIGESRSTSPGFAYHDVAIRTTSSGTRQVFDATLQPDWDPDLTDAINDFRLAQGRSFGVRVGARTLNPQGSGYLQRLLEPFQKQWDNLAFGDAAMLCLDSCDGVEPPPDPVMEPLLEFYRQEIDQVPPSNIVIAQDEGLKPYVVQGFRTYDRIDKPFHLAALGKFVSASVEFAYVATGAQRQDGKRAGDRRFRLSMAWSQTEANAREALAWLLTQNDMRLSRFKSRHKAPVGDIAFTSLRRPAIYLVLGNVLGRIISIGESPAPVEQIAESVDTQLRRRFARGPKARQVPEEPGGSFVPEAT